MAECPYHEDFTPTTDQVRSVYALGQGDHSEAVAWRIECFNRWLASVAEPGDSEHGS